MNILLTNDDGYQSTAIQQLCSALSALEGIDVYVVAPDSQKSAFSHAIMFHKPVSYEKLDNYYGAKAAYISSGTPANCVNYGISMLGVNIDMVISGPNNGANYGYDILYSGTVGAAEEAVVKGIRGVAVSLHSVTGTFEVTVDFVVSNIDKLYSFCKPNTVININVPYLPKEDIKGVVVVPQSAATLYEDFYKHHGDNLYSLEGHASRVHNCNDDVTMCNAGYITISPLMCTRTDYDSIEQLKQLFELQ